ncbi:hypothetical protein ACF05T_32920 [Streptomyces lateritius]|uniref:SMP-30/Gluconolactonase/LRE-like region domain-containing protein n=1 Tax=Streptomyces lateritius TaxID=67313 RepID=A0ABW6YLQ3_9ACTN
MPRLPHLAAAATATVALTLLASGPTSAGEPTVSHPRVVAHFDFAAGETPESIALEPDGSADLSFSFARQVVNVDKQGTRRVLATLPAVDNPNTPVIVAAAVMGLARAHDGTLYVNYATGTDATGIYRIAPDGGATVRIAQLPADGFPNGLALDEKCDALYVADSVRGTVWRVPQEGGTPTAWATGAALQPLAAPAGLGVGVNGIQVHDGAVWVSNTDRKTLSRIPVRPDKSAGPIETRATGLDWIDDFAFTGHDDTVLAALIADHEVALVRPDGTHKVVLTAQDGLSNPTSVAVRGRKAYVPSASYFAPVKDPNLLLARLDKKGWAVSGE